MASWLIGVDIPKRRPIVLHSLKQVDTIGTQCLLKGQYSVGCSQKKSLQSDNFIYFAMAFKSVLINEIAHFSWCLVFVIC